jgi:hemerythrin superfamily protein
MASGTKMAATVAGKTKRAAKAMAGYAAIFNHLAEEHAQVSILMKRLANSSDGSDIREELFPEIRKNLLAHACAEEEEFYPPLREHPELSELVAQSLKEHQQTKQYLEQLHAGNKDTKTWAELFRRMMRAVESHVELEENELFPKANELMSEERTDQIESRYEDAEERQKAHL